MACACKAGQQIDYLNRRYAVDRKGSQKVDVDAVFKRILRGLAVKIVTLPFIPFIALYVLINSVFRGKTIHITKMTLAGKKS